VSIGKHLATFNLFREADHSIHVTIADARGVQNELGNSGAPLHLCAMNALRQAVELRSPWQPMAEAPQDGTRIKLRVVYEFEAEWHGGLLNSDEEECGGWHAIRGDIPPCWTDDICWESNADESPSAAPDSWQPLPDPPEQQP
jgi:hypothetical protein